MTPEYRAAFEATGADLHNMIGLSDALYQLAVEHPLLGSSDRTATAILALICAVQEKAGQAVEHHSGELAVVGASEKVAA